MCTILHVIYTHCLEFVHMAIWMVALWCWHSLPHYSPVFLCPWPPWVRRFNLWAAVTHHTWGQLWRRWTACGSSSGSTRSLAAVPPPCSWPRETDWGSYLASLRCTIVILKFGSWITHNWYWCIVQCTTWLQVTAGQNAGLYIWMFTTCLFNLLLLFVTNTRAGSYMWTAPTIIIIIIICY